MSIGLYAGRGLSEKYPDCHQSVYPVTVGYAETTKFVMPTIVVSI